MKRPRVRVGCVVRRGTELLLIRRRSAHGRGTWSTPGGDLELGEEPARRAVRGAEEEAGAQVGKLRYVGMTNDVIGRKRHYVTLWYEGEYTGGDVHVRDRRELAEVGWFDEQDLPEPLFPPFKNLLEGGARR